MSQQVRPLSNWAGTRLDCSDVPAAAQIVLGDGEALVIDHLIGAQVYLTIGDPSVEGSNAGWFVPVGSVGQLLVLDTNQPFFTFLFANGMCDAGLSATILLHRVIRTAAVI